MSESRGWIAVDLDGTLAFYDEWRGIDHVGPPITPMVERVKTWIAEGADVRIFTARVHPNQSTTNIQKARYWIEKWCIEHLGKKLAITNEKDFGMIALYDDRCVQVEHNTGRPIVSAKGGGE